MNTKEKAELSEIRSEFAILSRACGNWREWPDKIVSVDVSDYTHDDWKAAAKAILERDNSREDERQACWEDFIQVIRNAIKDAPHSMALKALHEAVFLMGWKELGTGDGKPIHKRENSAVSEWMAMR